MSWQDVRGWYQEQDEDESPDFKELSRCTHVARKAHECECGGWIMPGETYTETVAIYDGDFRIFRDGHHDHGEAEAERDREYDEAMKACGEADLEHQVKAEALIDGTLVDPNAMKFDDDDIPF